MPLFENYLLTQIGGNLCLFLVFPVRMIFKLIRKNNSYLSLLRKSNAAAVLLLWLISGTSARLQSIKFTPSIMWAPEWRLPVLGITFSVFLPPRLWPIPSPSTSSPSSTSPTTSCPTHKPSRPASPVPTTSKDQAANPVGESPTRSSTWRPTGGADSRGGERSHPSRT